MISKPRVCTDRSTQWAVRFVGAGAFHRPGFDLEVGQKIVDQHDQLLPSIVGLVLVGGDGLESQRTLELADDLLMQAAARPKAPQATHAQLKVGGHRSIFPSAVVGVETSTMSQAEKCNPDHEQNIRSLTTFIPGPSFVDILPNITLYSRRLAVAPSFLNDDPVSKMTIQCRMRVGHPDSKCLGPARRRSRHALRMAYKTVPASSSSTSGGSA